VTIRVCWSQAARLHGTPQIADQHRLSSAQGRTTLQQAHYMSAQQALLGLCRARLRVTAQSAVAPVLGALGGGAEVLDRAAVHSSASTSASAAAEGAAGKDTCVPAQQSRHAGHQAARLTRAITAPRPARGSHSGRAAQDISHVLRREGQV